MVGTQLTVGKGAKRMLDPTVKTTPIKTLELKLNYFNALDRDQVC